MAASELVEEWSTNRRERASGIVLADLGAVYIPIPKVACTSLKTVCAELLCLHGDVHFEIDWPLVDLDELRELYAGSFVFAFVRNPWDRLVSCFRSKIVPGRDDDQYGDGVEFNFWKYGSLFRGNMPFDEFIRATASIPDGEADIHFGSQYRHVMSQDGSLLVDDLGRFESLSDDFGGIMERLGVARVRLPHLYRTGGGHYSSYYDADTRALVARRWSTDIETFGSSFAPSP